MSKIIKERPTCYPKTSSEKTKKKLSKVQLKNAFLTGAAFHAELRSAKKIHLSIKSGSSVEDCPDPFTLLAHILLCTYLLYAISECEFSLPVEFTGSFLHGKMSMLEYLKVPNGK